jgi:hypothetical protein
VPNDFAFPKKQKRRINKEAAREKRRVVGLRKAVASGKCEACGKGNAHPHHLVSRGAGGLDVEENLLTLCFTHHVGDEGVHRKGLTWLANKYGNVKQALLLKGWRYSEYRAKWIHLNQGTE